MVVPQAVIRPQSGPQEQFLAANADIVIYGGAAGGGKSYALTLMPLRHLNDDGFSCVTFRRESTDLTKPGGLWDEALNLYSPINGASSVKQPALMWRFPKDVTFYYGHLQHEKDVFGYQGAQIPLIQFDELTHFTEFQFFYLVGRNRNPRNNGVKPYVRAACNPDPDSWVRTFIDWWIGPDGYPLKDRAGKIRWFIRLNNKILWADTPDELQSQYGADVLPKSVTFIPASIFDNDVLLKNDPGYLANLKALPDHEMKKMLYGNWNARPTGSEFDSKYIQYYNNKASNFSAMGMNVYILYDPANTKRDYSDYTAIVVLGLASDNNYYVLDLIRDRLDPKERVDKLFKIHKHWNAQTANVPTVICEQYGMMTDAFYIQERQKALNYRFHIEMVGGKMKKEDRIRRLIPIWESRRIYLPQFMEYITVEGEIIDLTKYLIEKEMMIFPSQNKHDDLIDAMSRIMDEDIFATFPQVNVHQISNNITLATMLDDPYEDKRDMNDFMDW